MKSHDDFLLAWSGRVVDLFVWVSSPDIEDRSLQSYCEEEEVMFWVVFILNLISISWYINRLTINRFRRKCLMQ